LAAQTGASLFLHAHAPPFWLNTPQHIWTYDKTESLSTVVLDSDVSITHLIAEVPVAHSSRHWNIIQTISGFGSMTVDWDLLRNSGKELLDKVWNGVRMIPEERLVILERR
jgi:alpha-1,6-mannosyltransferase